MNDIIRGCLAWAAHKHDVDLAFFEQKLPGEMDKIHGSPVLKHGATKGKARCSARTFVAPRFSASEPTTPV